MPTLQHRAIRNRGRNFWAACICLLTTLGLGLPLAEPAGVPGVLITVQGQIRCTGFNVRQVGDKVYALTAAHCLGKDQVMLTDAMTAEGLGVGLPVFIVGDIAVLVYTSDKTVLILPLTDTRPGFGNPIWACGVVQEILQAVCFPGSWSGDSLTYKGYTVYLATLPVRSGFSGGPIGADKGVFAIYSIQLGASITGTTLVQPVIKFLEGLQ